MGRAFTRKGREGDGGADPGGEGGLGQGDGQAAVGEVVGAGQESARGQGVQEAVKGGLGGEVEGRWGALQAAGGQALPDRAAELDPGRPQEPDLEAGAGEAGGDGGGNVGEQAEDAHDGGRVDGPAGDSL
jgi:hypothetical protein